MCVSVWPGGGCVTCLEARLGRGTSSAPGGSVVLVVVVVVVSVGRNERQSTPHSSPAILSCVPALKQPGDRSCGACSGGRGSPEASAVHGRAAPGDDGREGRPASIGAAS